MNDQPSIEQSHSAKPTLGQWIKRFIQIILGILIIEGILFLIAGRLDWTGAWVLSFLYFVFLIVVVVWTMRNDPGLMEERSKRAENVKPWDKVILTVYTIMLVGMLVVAALDAGRFRWSEMPLIVQALGVIGLIPLGLLLLWVTATNSYLSSYARIQQDRGQQVVTTGPYKYVRHPMYAAVIPFIICVVLILGSWWALIPGGVIGVLFIIRTALEDRMLQDELPGYKEYTQCVRYRLLPGIW
jgi:protein-S-isoprenylcysteine O-methyltransferase Ste14